MGMKLAGLTTRTHLKLFDNYSKTSSDFGSTQNLFYVWIEIFKLGDVNKIPTLLYYSGPKNYYWTSGRDSVRISQFVWDVSQARGRAITSSEVR